MGLDLAVHLGLQFVDLDQDIEKETKLSISQIFEQKGEAHFRQLEKFHLDRVIAHEDSFVMATGGGTPCFFSNMQVMKDSGTTIFLDTPITTIEERLKLDTSRPLLKKYALSELLKKRKEWYSQADHTIQEYKDILKLF